MKKLISLLVVAILIVSCMSTAAILVSRSREYFRKRVITVLTSFGVELEMSFQNIMSVNVPKYQFHTKGQVVGEIYPYGFAATSGELDDAVAALSQVFQDMLHLAEIEKTSQLLAEEIEKTRRRVNALEYVMIPELEQNIKYITMKLEENDRSSRTRLMKVKDMLLDKAHHYSAS